MIMQQPILLVLRDFENSVLATPVPGEGRAWCDTVLSTVDELLTILHQQHADQGVFRRVTREEDIGLLHHVRRVQSNILRSLRKLAVRRRRLERLLKLMTAVQPSSREPLRRIRRLRRSLLLWTTLHRADEVELDSLLDDVVFRDEGQAG